eukprot:TRINITY_DN1410_c0_g1_i3.p1 TRINITY_DN1410_c0_g1~~TRINITY_DN1410_c0_g1_i3.p1  ORF type:complete len:135 (-),score=7.12 TRINITY_DN1410_c0_g1_i3:66-470(-)
MSTCSWGNCHSVSDKVNDAKDLCSRCTRKGADFMEPEQVIFQTENAFSRRRQELDPEPPPHEWRWWHIASVWLSITLSIPHFMMISASLSLGMNFIQCLVATWVSCILLALFACSLGWICMYFVFKVAGSRIIF